MLLGKDSGESGSTNVLDAGGCVERFAEGSDVAWWPEATLTILNWNGSTSGGGTHQVIFGSSRAGMTPQQAAQIRFLNPGGLDPGVYTARILDTGELVPTTQLPAAPTNLSATAPSSMQINLTWTDNANNEEGFTIDRSTDNSSFFRIASVGANATSYSDTGLAAGTTFYYRVRAFNGDGASAWSNPAQATTPAASLPTVTVTASDPNASEAGPDPGEFTISRSGSTASPPTVRFVVGGSAGFGTDYQRFDDPVIIPAGQTSAVITVTPIDDSDVEDIETVVLTLNPDA